jgi:hypothetical protein
VISGLDAIDARAPASASAADDVVQPSHVEPVHRFHNRPVTPELRRLLIRDGVEVLTRFSVSYRSNYADPRDPCRRQMLVFLDWLDTHPGETWEQRWQAAEAEMPTRSREWAAPLRSEQSMVRQMFWRGAEATISLGR